MKLLYYPDKRLFVKPEDCDGGVNTQIFCDMLELMRTKNGVGLSAIQVGIPKAFFVMEVNSHTRLIINPKILEMGGPIVAAMEGCLSVPGHFEVYGRYDTVKLEHGLPGGRMTEDFAGFAARVVQHETEHCEGKMFLDPLSKARKGAILGHMMKLRKAGQLK